MKKYLKNIQTIEQLKREYRKLAKKLHPDNGGSTAEMQILNAEYAEWHKVVKNIHEAADGSTYEKENTENVNAYPAIIQAIINFNIDIEIVGSWVWCFNAYECKDELKKLGFRWASKKKAWYWHSDEDSTANRKPLSMDKIRELHGSEQIKKHEVAKMLTA